LRVQGDYYDWGGEGEYAEGGSGKFFRERIESTYTADEGTLRGHESREGYIARAHETKDLEDGELNIKW